VLDDAPPQESANESAEPPESIADSKEELAPESEQPTELAESKTEALPPAQTSRAKRHRHPRYQYQRPGWGGMLSYSPDAFGGDSGITGLAGESLRALHFSYEWQPRFLQAIGVIGLGPQLGAYPILPEGDVLSGPTSIWSYGARIHYQARFFREQPIVPFVSYTYEKLSYELKAGTSGTGTLTGMSFGGMFLLNWLEPHAAAEAFVSSGVLRTYLVTEYRQLSGTYSTGGGPSGNTLSFGLRLEH
jgi:hypothetical protein